MVTTPLVEPNIEAGGALVEALDQAGFDYVGAFWQFKPDIEAWRFIIATPLVDDVGPRRTYEQLNKLVFNEPARVVWLADHGLHQTDVSVVSPGSTIVKLLRKVIKTQRTNQRIRLTGNVVDGTFIDDVLVYRML